MTDDVSKLPAWPEHDGLSRRNGDHAMPWYMQERVAYYRARMEALVDVVRMLPRSCDNVHHERADRHEDNVPCPVVLRIVALLAACERRIDA